MIRMATSRTLRDARAMLARTSLARVERIRSCARRRARSTSDALRKSRVRLRARSMTLPKRLVMLSRIRPIPEMRMTGPIESCNVGMRLASDMIYCFRLIRHWDQRSGFQYSNICLNQAGRITINLSYNKHSPAASIGWGVFSSASWGRFGRRSGDQPVAQRQADSFRATGNPQFS